MSSLSSLVASDGPLHLGVVPGPDVRALQVALSQAGYRVDIHNDGQFTDDTDYWLRQFQRQHDLPINGILDKGEAAILDLPHADIITAAKPLVSVSGWPHDDTASLLAFYGKPWEDGSLITRVPVPFSMTYRNDDGSSVIVREIAFHTKAAGALEQALKAIRDASLINPSVLQRVKFFSGSGNYRSIRGSSRLSTHAFWAGIDFDSEHLPLGKIGITADDMPAEVVLAFDAVKFFWGNRYNSRKDPMHFQAAHE